MDRQARREYFDRICKLRDRYARLGRADTTSAITVEAMIALATRLMNEPVAAETMVSDPNPATS